MNRSTVICSFFASTLLIILLVIINSFLAGSADTGSYVPLACDCRLSIGNTVIDEGPDEFPYLNGTYINYKNPSSMLIFKPDCTVACISGSSSKSFYYQTKASAVILSTTPHIVPGVTRLTEVYNVSDGGDTVNFQGDTYRRV